MRFCKACAQRQAAVIKSAGGVPHVAGWESMGMTPEQADVLFGSIAVVLFISIFLGIPLGFGVLIGYLIWG